jgi:carnitine O-acetyltransferase
VNIVKMNLNTLIEVWIEADDFVSCADGFFDAGMLLQALKARGEGLDDGAAKTPDVRRREIGKKLRLSEY